VIFNQLSNSLPDEYKHSYTVFAVLSSTIIDIDVHDTDDVELNGLAAWWQMKSNIPADNYQLFEQLLTTSLVDILWQGYDDTRAVLPPAPEITQESKPPVGNPLDSTGSQAKKGKRGKRHTKAVS
jgi:hypothetical protein